MTVEYPAEPEIEPDNEEGPDPDDPSDDDDEDLEDEDNPNQITGE
jgi:hypothetical protein